MSRAVATTGIQTTRRAVATTGIQTTRRAVARTGIQITRRAVARSGIRIERRALHAGSAASLVLLFGLVLSGCASFGRPAATNPLRVQELREQGDAARRASLRLVLDGLEDDSSGAHRRAGASYERAIQVDATNPYAYLAFARHLVEGSEPLRALPFLDQAESLLRSQGALSPRVRPHIDGLRGEAHYVVGNIGEGIPLLEAARSAAPRVWSDGHLSAEELR